MTGGAYFPFYLGKSRDKVARMVRAHLGHEGFDAYVTLLDMLNGEDGGRLQLQSDEDWEDLGEQFFGLGVDFAKELVALLVNYGVLVWGDGYVFAPVVSAAQAAYEDAREAKSRAARARWDKERRRKAEERGADDDASHDAVQ